MRPTEYQQRIVDYYRSTEHAYRDSWDLDHSLAIHYGYWDEQVHTFRQSLMRMNEVMAETAAVKDSERVLDAGCGVGGSSIYLANKYGCDVTGISLSERQISQAIGNSGRLGKKKVEFRVMDYCSTTFESGSFDVVWGCESICYADDKSAFIREAYRLLKPGGRLIVADGFVTDFNHNKHPVIRQWLEGWQVNYLESPARFGKHMQESGFSAVTYSDISRHVQHSARRLWRFYYLASLYVWWRKMTFSGTANHLQKGNIRACKYQYHGLKKGLWQYGIITGTKV